MHEFCPIDPDKMSKEMATTILTLAQAGCGEDEIKSALVSARKITVTGRVTRKKPVKKSHRYSYGSGGMTEKELTEDHSTPYDPSVGARGLAHLLGELWATENMGGEWGTTSLDDYYQCPENARDAQDYEDRVACNQGIDAEERAWRKVAYVVVTIMQKYDLPMTVQAAEMVSKGWVGTKVERKRVSDAY